MIQLISKLKLLGALTVVFCGLSLRAQQADASPADNSDTTEVPEAVPGKRERRVHVSKHHHDVVKVGSDFTLLKDESVGDVVVIGGDADIQGEVNGDLVVISGHAKLSGKVDGQFVTVLSPTVVSSNAVVKHKAVFVGSSLEREEGAYFHQEPTVVAGNQWKHPEALQQWLSKGLMYGRPLPHQYAWPWIVAAVLLGFNILLATLFARPVGAILNVFEHRPASAFFSGIAALFVFGFLVVSVVGLIVVPFALCAMFLGLWLGKVALCEQIGMRVGAGISLLSQPIPALVVGSLVLTLMYMVPIIGFLAMGLLMVQALGGAVLATFGAFKRESPPPVASFSGGSGTLGASIPVSTGTIPIPEQATSGAANVPPLVSTPPRLAGAETVYMPRVGFWRRFWAMMLDLILLSFVFMRFPKGLFVIILAVYFVAMWTWKGTTIGSIVLGLKLVRTDGAPVNFGVALVRSLASFFSAMVFFLGFFWAGWDPEKQSWHDKIAGTVIVRVPKGMPLI